MKRARHWMLLRQENLFRDQPEEIILPEDAIQEAVSALAELLLAYARSMAIRQLNGGNHELLVAARNWSTMALCVGPLARLSSVAVC